MEENKQEKYLRISKEIVNYVGGEDNIQGVAHCATRLRIVLTDNNLADIEKLENIDSVKGVFIAGNQLQLIFGAGLVNEVYEVFSRYTHTENMSLGDIKAQSATKTKSNTNSNQVFIRCFYRYYAWDISCSITYGDYWCFRQMGCCCK